MFVQPLNGPPRLPSIIELGHLSIYRSDPSRRPPTVPPTQLTRTKVGPLRPPSVRGGFSRSFATGASETEGDRAFPAAQRNFNSASSPERSAGANRGPHAIDRPEAGACPPPPRPGRSSGFRKGNGLRCRMKRGGICRNSGFIPAGSAKNTTPRPTDAENGKVDAH